MKALAITLLLTTTAIADPVASKHERGSDEYIRDVLQQGLDEALQEQVKVLFQNWLRHGGEQGRAKIGMLRAIDAYRRANKAFEGDLHTAIDGMFRVQSETSRPVKLLPRR